MSNRFHVLIKVTSVFHAFYFQEEKVLHESVKKIADNLTQPRKEINRTQQDMINNVRSF